MLSLSTKPRYGLRILLQIAYDTERFGAVKGRRIAEQQNISEAYLEQIMIPLKSAEFIKTVRGRNGGYTLNKEPEEITVLDVIELFEGRVYLSECENKSSECSFYDRCPTRSLWKRLEDNFRSDAASIKISELLEEMKEKQTMEYVI